MAFRFDIISSLFLQEYSVDHETVAEHVANGHLKKKASVMEDWAGPGATRVD